MENKKIEYVKIDKANIYNFDSKYNQAWHHSFNMQGVRPAYVYIKNFMDRRNAENIDLAIDMLRFILNFTFVTKKQIEDYLETKGYYIKKVEDLIDYYIKARILNKFALSTSPLQTIPEDALVCYCLDFGGKHILSHYGKDDLIEWTSVNAARSVELVVKYLTTTNFYLSLLKSKGEDLTYFDGFKNFELKKGNMQTSAVFQIKNNHNKRDFIFDVVKGYDIPVNAQNKSHKYYEFYSSEMVKKYFKVDPVILFLAENDEVAFEFAEIFYRFTENKHFRLMTDKRIANGFNERSFLKYDPEKEKMIVVKSSLFV
jgi:hypothetical protein